MADAFSAIPAAVLRNLSDKLYEKRKNAAIEVRVLLLPWNMNLSILGFWILVLILLLFFRLKGL